MYCDHFRSRFRDIVRQGIRPCVDCGMVTDHTRAVDTAPIKANASMESVVPKMSGQGWGDRNEALRQDLAVPPGKPKTGSVHCGIPGK